MPENNPMAYMLDPKLLQQQAQGISAANQLKALPQSAEYARALRQSEATLPESVGQGYAQTGPNFMNLIAMMADRSAGRKNLGALDSRSEILRQQAQTGTEAGLQAEQQAKQNEFMQRQQEFEADRAFQRERDLMSQGQIKGPFRTWVNDEGHKIGVSNTGEGAITTDGTPPPVGYYPYDRPPAGDGGPNAHVEKKAIPAVAALKNINQARKLADELDSSDLNQLDQVGKQVAVQALSPKAIEQYIEANWMNYSPEVKRYLSTMRAITAQARHALTGSAMTKFEEMITNAFLPTPTTKGLTMEDRMSRLGTLYDRSHVMLQSIDEVTGSEYVKPYGQWEPWKPNFTKEAGIDTGLTDDAVLTPRLQELYDQYYQRTGRRHEGDPRQSKKIDKKGAKDIGDMIGELEFE